MTEAQVGAVNIAPNLIDNVGYPHQDVRSEIELQISKNNWRYFVSQVSN